MKHRAKITLILTALCLTTAGAGWLMGRRNGRQQAEVAMHPPAGIAAAPPSNGKSLSEEIVQARQRGLAACETAALWKWLAEREPEADAGCEPLVMDELLDRLGAAAAVNRALEIPERGVSIAGRLLERRADQDPWGADAIYQAHRTEWADGPPPGLLRAVLSASCSISAAKIIEAAEDATNGDKTARVLDFAAGNFAPDFDFPELANYYAERNGGRELIASALLPEWARRSPEEAQEWLARVSGESSKSMAKAFATGACEGKDVTGIAAGLLREPDEKRISNTRGDLENSELDSHRTDGDLPEFLSDLLLSTRGRNTLAGSGWESATDDEKKQALDAALIEWEKQDASPRADRARANWKRMVEESWGW